MVLTCGTSNTAFTSERFKASWELNCECTLQLQMIFELERPKTYNKL